MSIRDLKIGYDLTVQMLEFVIVKTVDPACILDGMHMLHSLYRSLL